MSLMEPLAIRLSGQTKPAKSLVIPRYLEYRNSGFYQRLTACGLVDWLCRANPTISFSISHTLCDQLPSKRYALRSEFQPQATVRQYRIVAPEAARDMERLINHRRYA
jgi:hypothetical protein